MTTFTAGASTYVPLTVDGFNSTRAGGNVVHELIGTTDDAIALAPARLRTGTFKCVFSSLALANAFANAMSAAASFSVADTDVSAVNMSFVIQGNIAVELDDETRDAAIVTLDYREIAA
jgi:hypothetical protein